MTTPLGLVVRQLPRRARAFYKLGRYEELFRLLAASPDGTEQFLALCQHDDHLTRWYAGQITAIMDRIFADPEQTARARAWYEANGLREFFAIQQQMHAVGFATVEEIVAALGVSVEEIQDTIAANPALFEGTHFTLTEQ